MLSSSQHSMHQNSKKDEISWKFKTKTKTWNWSTKTSWISENYEKKNSNFSERESLQSTIEGEMVRVATLWNEIENPNWSETGRRKGEEEDDDEDNITPLSSNGKSITIAPPTTTTFPSPIPSGATATKTAIPLPQPSSIRESDHNDVFNFCRRWCEVWGFERLGVSESETVFW